jgi:clan AA aspartic protease
MTPLVDLEAIGPRGPLSFAAILDTGFEGQVCLPVRFAVTLGLTLVVRQMIELADGTQKWELVFAGAIRFLGRTRKARTYLTDSEDALVGTGLLSDCRLSIDFTTGKVMLSRKPRASAKRKP